MNLYQAANQLRNLARELRPIAQAVSTRLENEAAVLAAVAVLEFRRNQVESTSGSNRLEEYRLGGDAGRDHRPPGGPVS